MSGESAPKPRLVLCPKCWLLLPESPDYDVYKCGGCGTTLQAKRRRSRTVSSESSTHETDASPINASDLLSDGKQYSNREQLNSPQENGLKEKATSSSSEECFLEGNDGRVQTENCECNEKKLVTSQENGLNAKATGSSSGECSLEGNGRNGQIENGECNGEQTVNSKENGFREKATSSYSEQCSFDGNGGRGQIENDECNEEQQLISQENDLREKTTNSSLEQSILYGNGGRVQIENGECNEDQQVISQENDLKVKATSSSSEECSLDGNGGMGQIENGKCSGEQFGLFNLSDEEPESMTDVYKGCSNELAQYEIEASAELMADNLVEKANDTNLQLEEEMSNGNVPLEGGEKLISALDIESANDEKSALVRVKSEGDIAGSDLQVTEELTNGNLLLERAGQELISGSDGEDVNNDQLALAGSSPEADVNGTNKAKSEELNNGKLLLEGIEEELNMCASDGEDPKNGQSALVGAKSVVDITGNASTAKRLTTENFVSEKGSISHVAPCKLKEGASGNHVSSKSTQHSFDHAKSVDFDNTEVINPSSEISGKLGELSKSPTTRSSHAYDGSVSSNDGLDERFPSQYLDSFENTYTAANGVSERVSRKGKGLVNSMLYGDLETQCQSYFPNRKHHVMQDSRRNQNEVPETTRHGHTDALWMRTKKDEFPPKIPLHRSGSQSGYESGSPSNQTHDELYCSSSYLSPDSFDDPDQEKMKLLRMIYKLQDQINRTSYANGETNVSLSTGKHISPYQSHDFHEGRFYHGLDYPRWDGRCSHGISWHQRHNISQIPYLAEPTSSVLHVDHPCFNCCPQEWQCSGEFPPHVLYQHEELCRPHLGHSCCSSHHSYPSSPQWIKTSKLAHGHETKSCDQRHRAPEMKNYFREKPSLTKRHYRPVAGGAPFLTCHKCLRLLQLPADFLLFKRVCHQLKCGACQEVLKFSLQNESHIVSYAPNALVPLSSDLDDQNEVIDGIGSNPHSESHANHYHSHADPVSYSDDYGHSVTKSYSSEGDPISLTSLHALNGSVHDKPSVTPGTFEPMTEKEVIALRGPSTSKAPVQTDEFAVRFSNVSSEIEARSLPKSSPLHQLMGYSSPSQVVRGVPSSVDGKEPILNGENDPGHTLKKAEMSCIDS